MAGSYSVPCLWRRIGQGDIAVSNLLHSGPTMILWLYSMLATMGKEACPSSDLIRRRITLPRALMKMRDFPPGKSLSRHVPGTPAKPCAAKPVLPPLVQRRRNLRGRVTRVLSSWAEREASAGVAVLSAGFFLCDFSS